MTDITLKPSLGLLDLADDVLNLIVGYLEATDRKRLLASCRRAAWVTLRAAEPKLTITNSTRFAGIKKVLDSNLTAIQLEVICPDTHLDHWDPVSAVTLFMGMAPSNYSKQETPCWEGITNVTVQGTMLGCMVPQFLVLACPKLTELTIRQSRLVGLLDKLAMFATEPADAKPMTKCTSLKQLTFDVCKQKPAPLSSQHHVPSFSKTSLQLPTAYHSAAELLDNLPNVDALIFKDEKCVPNGLLIDTFAKQLTRLEIEGDSNKVADSVRLCSKLQHLRVNKFTLPGDSSSVRLFDLFKCVTSDNDIKQLLQLPSLTTVRLGSLLLHTDWSGQACPWQELHIGQSVWFTSLAHLNLINLKRISIGPHVVITLPYSVPGILSPVQRAADSLAGVGQIVVEAANTTATANASIRWQFVERPFRYAIDSEQDAAGAELITVASQRVGPVKTCELGHLFRRPLAIAAIIDWGKTFIESVSLFNEDYPAASIWQALNPLHALKSVTMCPTELSAAFDSGCIDHLNNIASTVSDAALNYVIPAQRSLCLQFGVRRPYNTTQASGLVQAKMVSLLQKTVQDYLQHVITKKLPASSRLVIVETVSDDKFDPDYSRYGWQFFWSVVIEPCQKTL